MSVPTTPGTVGVDGDTRARELLGRSLGQGAHGKLRRRIQCEHGEPVVTRDRGRVDDLAAVPALLEFLRRGLDSPQHALDVAAKILETSSGWTSALASPRRRMTCR